MDDKKLYAIVAFVAAAGLLFSAVSRRWMATNGADAGFGPRGWSCVDCAPGHPLSGAKSNQDLVEAVREARKMAMRRGYPDKMIPKEPSSFFPIAGWITIAFSLLTAGLLTASGVLAIRRGLPERPIAPNSFAILGLLATVAFGLVFVAQNPLRHNGVQVAGVSWVFGLFGVSVIAGFVAMAKLRQKKPEPGDIIL
jgi:hypothetical protein